jgi:hypothetical protein
MDEYRLCKQCRFVKPVNLFYVSNQARCKDCVKQSVRSNRAEKIDYYKAYDRARAMIPHRVKARQEYQQTPNGKAAVKRAHENYIANNRKRRQAHIDVGNAIKYGRISKLPCFVCGDKAHAHHPDYDRPLDVVWLCPQHHKEAHKVSA